jgi:hypothetical protein
MKYFNSFEIKNLKHKQYWKLSHHRYGCTSAKQPSNDWYIFVGLLHVPQKN